MGLRSTAVDTSSPPDVPQQPDRLSRAEWAALQALKRGPPRAVRALASAVGVSRQAMRQTIEVLTARGLVVSAPATGRRRRLGRPPRLYQLSEGADELFPRAYDLLAKTLVAAVQTALGGEALHRVLEAVTAQRVAEARPRVEGLPLAERVEAMRTLYAEGDPYVDVEVREDGYVLTERNCPFARVAQEYPALCATSVATLSRLLDRPVRRIQRLQDGDGLCAFFVPAACAEGEHGTPVLPEPPAV